jgi:nitroimidazol reductase NimA-like FMN-containing flavoprotein (pyridoxamine 5'-phosphate oxidase superfamily)
MSRVIRDIDVAEARDLLEGGRRACMAFPGEGEPLAEPVAVVYRDERYLAGIASDAHRRPRSGDEVVLVIDEGVYFFDLRAVYVRGRAEPVEAPSGAPEGFSWFRIEPGKTAAWDYGRLREVDDES